MTLTPFDWSRLIAELTDESFGIQPDVTFQMEENGQLHEIKAHKMILGLVSPTFKTMFYATYVGDKTAKMTKIDKTNAIAFQIVMDAVFNIKSIEASLKGKSVDDVFYVVKLLERYQIAELMEAVKDELANFPITDDTVLEVAAKAMEYTTLNEAESNLLLITCAKFLEPKLKDTKSMIRYAMENEDRKEVFATLLARMNDIVPSAQKVNVTATPFDWSRLIAEMTDESFGIPPDVTFQIEDNGQLHEVKAHKMILGMVSPTFKTMFFATDVGDKTVTVIKIEKTTAPAFRIMMDAVYNAKSIKDSLMDKSVHEVFDVVILVERYQIMKLIEAAKKHIVNFPIADDTVLEVAGDAMEYTNMFKAETQLLLCNCAKFLMPKLKDSKAMIRYAAENEERKEVFATLLARMNDIPSTECPNCKKEICQDWETVGVDEFREGLVVTNFEDCDYWDKKQIDMGTGRVTMVKVARVNVVPIKPRDNLPQFHGGDYPITHSNLPTFRFSCN